MSCGSVDPTRVQVLITVKYIFVYLLSFVITHLVQPKKVNNGQKSAAYFVQ